jgi:hypothetical protein
VCRKVIKYKIRIYKMDVVKSFTGLKDADREILMKIDSDQELLSTCLLSKYSLSLCNDDFYHNRMILKFPYLLSFYPKNTDWKLAYLQNMYYIGKMNEEYGFSFEQPINGYSSSGIPRIYYQVLEKYAKRNILENKQGKPFPIVTPNANTGLKFSVTYGFLNLAEYFISFGADNFIEVLLFITAINKSSIIIIEYLLNKISNLEPIRLLDIMTNVFQTAYAVNNSVAMDYFVSKINLNEAMVDAAISKNYKLLNYLANQGGDLTQAARLATEKGYLEAAILLEKYDVLYSKLTSLKNRTRK